MLPNKIVGSVVASGATKPFVIDTPTGKVTCGQYESPDPDQRNMGSMEATAVDKQVRASVNGASDVRIGQYRCPKCDRWVDVVKSPKEWSGDRCARC